jgi:hypothetical protein
VSGWTHWRKCQEHGTDSCDCEQVFKHDLWRLMSDSGEILGSVQCFNPGDENEPAGPFYGNTAAARTGAMSDRLKCQAAVEKMIEGSTLK